MSEPSRKRPGPKPGDPRTVESGRRGGRAAVDAHGVEHFRAIGQRGGQRTLELHGVAHFRRIGRLAAAGPGDPADLQAL